MECVDLYLEAAEGCEAELPAKHRVQSALPSGDTSPNQANDETGREPNNSILDPGPAAEHQSIALRVPGHTDPIILQ